MRDRAALLRESFEMIVERDPQFTRRFYGILFQRFPEVRPLFTRNSSADQERMLGQALAAVLDHLDDAPWLTRNLAALGARHAGYGVTPEMYSWVGQALLQALEEVLGPDWTQDTQAAWTDAYMSIVQLMTSGVSPADAATQVAVST